MTIFFKNGNVLDDQKVDSIGPSRAVEGFICLNDKLGHCRYYLNAAEILYIDARKEDNNIKPHPVDTDFGFKKMRKY